MLSIIYAISYPMNCTLTSAEMILLTTKYYVHDRKLSR
jgi:hypothetical protein